jgi:hypothetical protein
MQQVISLIEALTAKGIEVPKYPQSDPPLAGPGGQAAVSTADINLRVELFEARVVAWRHQIVELYTSHFGPPPPQS